MKIGITERGDPSIDFSWVSKLKDMDGTILITKNLTDAVLSAATPYLDKMIFHITCTGMGGSCIEPNIPPFTKQLEQAQKLLSMGVPQERVVIRVDPIVPTNIGLHTARTVLETAYQKGFRRFRVSILDCYPHVRKRLAEHNITAPYGAQRFAPLPPMVQDTNNMLSLFRHSHADACVESCAEPDLSATEITGCISEKDFRLLNLPVSQSDTVGYQRKHCLCCSAKTELLTQRKQCPYGCLYCYWR